MARILVCDDSDFMRGVIVETLESGGHEIVGEACDGREAVEKFRQQRPDIVTMDILMKTNGDAAIKEIIKLDPAARILIISILDNHQAEIIEGIRYGALGYVGKPIKRDILIGEVDRVLGL